MLSITKVFVTQISVSAIVLVSSLLPLTCKHVRVFVTYFLAISITLIFLNVILFVTHLLNSYVSVSVIFLLP